MINYEIEGNDIQENTKIVEDSSGIIDMLNAAVLALKEGRGVFVFLHLLERDLENTDDLLTSGGRVFDIHGEDEESIVMSQMSQLIENLKEDREKVRNFVLQKGGEEISH